MKIWLWLMFIYLGLVYMFEPAWGYNAPVAHQDLIIEAIDCKEVICPSYVDNKQTTQKTIKARVFGYTSLVELTDSTPFITASGQRVYAGGVANNCQVFGTQVQIDSKIFTVNDRMASRYGCSDWDIWFPTLQEAKEWGVKEVDITIL